MTVECGTGAHDFRARYPEPGTALAAGGYHTHVCVDCGATYLANCDPCEYPEVGE